MAMGVDNKVRNHFMTHVCNLTPASLRHAVHVLFAPVSDDSDISGLCVSVLSKSERQAMERKSVAGQRAEFAQRRAFRRFCAATALGSARSLSELVFEETDKGRPYLHDKPGLWFSFSSCRFGMLGAWSSAYGIGVDIEDRTRELDALDLARQFFSVTETAAIERLRGADRLKAFYQLWSLKEAALKSIGEGLPFGLDAFEFDLHPRPRCIDTPAEYGGPGQIYAHDLAGGRMSAALVARDMAGELKQRDVA